MVFIGLDFGRDVITISVISRAKRVAAPYRATTLKSGHRFFWNGLDFDSVPKSNAAFNTLGQLARIWVVPRRVAIDFVPRDDDVVTGHALPVADRVTFAGPKVLSAHVCQRKGMIALDDHSVAAVSNDLAIPSGPIASTPAYRRFVTSLLYEMPLPAPQDVFVGQRPH